MEVFRVSEYGQSRFFLLYEPAGSVHTLTTDVSDSSGPTDIWFAIRGANLNLDKEGEVESIVDASSIYPFTKKRKRQVAQCRML